MRTFPLIIFIMLFALHSIVFAQEVTGSTPLPGMRGTPNNLPDISVIGDIIGKVASDKNDLDRNKILVREIELALQGYIYPEMRADVFLAMHRHGDHVEPEICEGYASFLRIVSGLSLKVGKQHIDFGKLNKIHQHEQPYVDQPWVLTRFFGDHGLVGEGATLAYLLPLPLFVQIDVGVWKVEAEHHEEEDTEALAEFGLADEVYTTRLWLSFPLGEKSELEVGASGVSGRGSHYLEHLDKAKVFGLDLTYKCWLSAYKRFIFQNEVLHLIRKVPAGELKRWGFYNYLGYQFSKYWDVGLRYDWTENAFSEKEQVKSLSGIITRHLTETTKIRFQYSYNLGVKSYEAFLQLVFGIGPHSHPLQ